MWPTGNSRQICFPFQMTKNNARNTIWVLHTLLIRRHRTLSTNWTEFSEFTSWRKDSNSLKFTPWMRRLNSGFRKDKTAGRTLQAKPARTEWFMREQNALGDKVWSWDFLETGQSKLSNPSSLQQWATETVKRNDSCALILDTIIDIFNTEEFQLLGDTSHWLWFLSIYLPTYLPISICVSEF